MSDDPPETGHATIVDVLIPVAVDQAYSYRAPPDMPLAPGDFVAVPLGPRETAGVVWSVEPAEGGRGANLKPVLGRRDIAPLRKPLRGFLDWLARWTLTPRGMVLRIATRAPDYAGPEPIRVGLRRAGAAPVRMTPARGRVLAALEATPVSSKAALALAAGCSAGVIDGLIDEGTIETFVLPPEPLAGIPDPDFARVALEPAQRDAAAALIEAVGANAFSTTLLEGVTGSGKTEVYFEAVAAALRAGRQVLIMMPEIALTAQFLDRFAVRFGTRPVEWHSASGPVVAPGSGKPPRRGPWRSSRAPARACFCPSKSSA